MNTSIVEQMIKESGHIWLGSMDRSETGSGPIIITNTPDRPIYLERRENYTGDLESVDGWILCHQPLRADDAAEFFAEFGASWRLLLECSLTVSGKPCRIRGFIKNGRKKGWTISLDIPKD